MERTSGKHGGKVFKISSRRSILPTRCIQTERDGRLILHRDLCSKGIFEDFNLGRAGSGNLSLLQGGNNTDLGEHTSKANGTSSSLLCMKQSGRVTRSTGRERKICQALGTRLDDNDQHRRLPCKSCKSSLCVYDEGLGGDGDGSQCPFYSHYPLDQDASSRRPAITPYHKANKSRETMTWDRDCVCDSGHLGLGSQRREVAQPQTAPDSPAKSKASQHSWQNRHHTTLHRGLSRKCQNPGKQQTTRPDPQPKKQKNSSSDELD